MAETKLRILQVSTSDVQGGAEQVARNLFAAYGARGCVSRLAVGLKRSTDADVLEIPNAEAHSRWYRFFQQLASRLATQRFLGRLAAPAAHVAGILSEPSTRLDYFRGVEDYHFPGTSRLLQLDRGQQPDVLHAHNLHGAYFDLRQLPGLSRQVPVTLTLHDAWLLSGHCAHSFSCERWRTGCGRCPDLTIYPPIQRDATGHNWRRKRRIFAHSRLYVATPSRWLMDRVHASILAPAIVEARVIPNGIDLSVFQPSDRQEARARLGIPFDAKVLLAAGVGLHASPWRDAQMLRAAVQSAADTKVGHNLILIALGEDAPHGHCGRAEIRFIPAQRNPADVARYLHAADIYLHPARADTFPSSVLEALACGIPVVATCVGGIPEQIEDSRTGFLVAAGDEQAMAARTVLLLQDAELRRAMGDQAAAHARRSFSLDRQVDTYLDWYRQQISEHPSTRLRQ